MTLLPFDFEEFDTSNPFTGGNASMFGKDTHNILNLIGFGGIATAIYGGVTDQNTILAIAGGVALASFYGAYRTMAQKVSELTEEETRNSMWRAQDTIHDRINELEGRLDSCVKTAVFDDALRAVHSEIEKNEAECGRSFDAVYRHIDSVSGDLNRRLHEAEIACSDCSGKRSK